MSVRGGTADSAAAVVERLATLLRHGVTPDRAWGYVAQSAHLARTNDQSLKRGLFRRANRTDASPARSSRTRPFWFDRVLMHRAWMHRASARTPRRIPATPVEVQIATAIRHGGDAGTVLASQPDLSWRALGAVWLLAMRTGAPLGAVLTQMASGFRELGQAERDVQAALAGPVSAARIVLALPILGLLLGAALGFNTIAVFTESLVGSLLFAVGVGLILAGWWWNRSLIRSAANREQTPGLALDLVAMGMLSGRSATQVRDAARQVLRECRLPTNDLARAVPILDLAEQAGVPAGSLLGAEAALARNRARTEAAQAAGRLGVQLMLPLGACILPAFLALGVAPLVVAVLRQVM